MPSLSQLVADHGPLLLIDAASVRVQTAILGADKYDWSCAEEEAGTGIYECVKRLDVDFEKVGGFVFCAGPGSILGIRTAAAALRTWKLLYSRPAWSYISLELVARSPEGRDFAVISDARRDSWNMVLPGEPLKRAKTENLPEGIPLATPEGFRRWTKLPAGKELRTLSYDLANLLPTINQLDLFLSCEEPDAFLHEEPIYATWTPQIHRAPS